MVLRQRVPVRPRLGAPLALAALVLLAGCGEPDYPSQREVAERFNVEYRDANCTLAKIHPPKRQPDSAGARYHLVHIRFEARCKRRTGSEESLERQQVWKLDSERPTLAQGAWRWYPAGEISVY